MKKLVMLSIVAVVVTFSYVGSAVAAEPSSPKAVTVTVKGEVTVTKDAKGNISAVSIISAMGKYLVTLDAKGKELGEKMANKRVEATGIVTVKDKEKWLTVEKYAEVQKPKPVTPAKRK